MALYAQSRTRHVPIFVTILTVLFFFVLILVNDPPRELNRSQKRTFTGVSTALVVVLSLSVTKGSEDAATAFSAWAVQKQWYITLSPKDRLSVDHIAEWFTVLRMLFTSFKPQKWKIFIACFLWGFMFLLTQAALAAVTPFVEVQDGTDYNHTYIKPNSDITIPDIACYHHWFGNRSHPTHFPCGPLGSYDEKSLGTQQAIAHRYGDGGRDALTARSGCGSYDNLGGQVPYRYFCKEDRSEFAYRFVEYNPADDLDVYPEVTKRIVRASSGPCISYNVTKLELTSLPDGANKNDTVSAWNYTYSNGSFNSNIIIPVANEAWDGTTYIYRGKSIPQNETEWSCGSRCLWMWVHINPGPSFNNLSSIFYQCPITISQVENSIRTEQELSDGMARLAAASIALQGRKGGDWQRWSQSQFYPIGTTWELHDRPIEDVGANMAEFAIASLSTLAFQNARITLPGNQPNLASYLSFKWWIIIALALFVVAVHIVLYCAMLWFTANTPTRPNTVSLPLLGGGMQTVTSQ